jgi:hypothetical protein
MIFLLISACSGITPDGNISNNREEGTEKGLISGDAGEFVIFSSSDTIEPR